MINGDVQVEPSRPTPTIVTKEGRITRKVIPGWPQSIKEGCWDDKSMIVKRKAMAILTTNQDGGEAVVRLAGNFERIAEIPREDFDRLLAGVDRSKCHIYIDAGKTPADKIPAVWGTVLSMIRG